MQRSLAHYWRINLAVVLGAAVATAVLTGALLVGDSVRGSLRSLTLERLGQIDYALVSDRFFRQTLAFEMAQDSEFEEQFKDVVPAILLTGSATHVATKARAASINFIGIDAHFNALFKSSPTDSSWNWGHDLTKKAGLIFPSIIINEALQKELNAKVGDQMLISFAKASDIPRESLLGNRNTSDLLETGRFTLARIIPDRGIGRFGFRPHQNLPLNAYVALDHLQSVLGESERINTLFVSRKKAAPAVSLDQTLQYVLHKFIRLDDYGISLQAGGKYISVESREIILTPTVASAVQIIATELKTPMLPLLTYLANTIKVNGRLLPYSTITALDMPVGESFGSLRLKDGTPAPALGENDILLNEWASQDLQAITGDVAEISYYVVGAGEGLRTQHKTLRVKGIVSIAELASDPHLTPAFPGMHEAEDMSSWDPPFPVDLQLIRPKDEAYWDQYRATPKAFVSLTAGQRLWSNRFGNLTSIRLGATAEINAEYLRKEIEGRLLEKLPPQQMGFVFQPVKQQGLEAAHGATDFSVLFLGFSLFLILSAALLVGMLFRLGVEQRANEVGLLLAVGYSLRAVRWRLFKEGGLLAGIGGLIGLGGAVFYAWLLMKGLRTWWVSAIGAPFIFLHVTITSLMIGYIAAMLVTLFSIWWTVRELIKVPAPALLHGVTVQDRTTKAKFSQITAFVSLGFAGVVMLLAIVRGLASSAELFFGSGTLLLIAGLSFLSFWTRNPKRGNRQLTGFASTSHMAIDYSRRQPGRSMLCAALIGCACFIIVAVAANRREFNKAAIQENSGTGGFSLVAEADIPLHHDLNTEEGRFELGFADAEISEKARIFPMRLLRGEDASCANLYKPQNPRLLGIPPQQIERGGFHFQAAVDSEPEFKKNPWLLVEREMEPGVIPAIGDYNSVLWIMHLGLGKDVVMQNERGEEIKLRFVGLLQSSIFQSEVLISEANFLKHFPSASGYAYFLIETPFERAGELSQKLENTLSAYGFDATSTLDRLAGFQAVENTYLSIFQTLGGLGLLLGALGLGIIVMRNVIERRGELAALRAFGFRHAKLGIMLLVENSFLIVVGMGIGSLSALLAVLPHLTSGQAQVPWLSLFLTLLFVLLVGLVSGALAVTAALRAPLLPALKAE